MTGRAAAAAAVLLLAAAAWAEQDGALPRIYLEKKIFAEEKGGTKSFYEVHTVAEGENLWKILKRIAGGSDARTAELVREFVKANPDVKNPARLAPGRRILLPTAAPVPKPAAPPGTVEHKVVRGDRLIKILSARGVPRGEMARYLAAVREINPSIRDVNRIIAGTGILIPTQEYFARREPEAPPAPAQAASTETAPAPAASAEVPPPRPAPAGPQAASAETPPKPPAPAVQQAAPSPGGEPVLTKAPPGASAEEMPVALPEAQVAAPALPSPEQGARSVAGAAPPETPAAPARKPPYRGLLSDVVRGLGESWQGGGTLYVPAGSGGEVVLNLEDFPMVRFKTGMQVLLDFGGRLDSRVRGAVSRAWKNTVVESVGDPPDPVEMIGRLLSASGYHSVKDGIARPLVVGDTISVEIPARFVVLKTDRSLLSGEVILLKEVPEKPPADLCAVIAYAARVGIRVIPFAADPSVREGFVVGIDEPPVAEAPALSVPARALDAVDFALGYLGIPADKDRRLQIGGPKGAFQLTVQPDRTFEANGRKFVVDAGRMSKPILALVRESGYEVLSLRRDEPGISVFRRVLAAAGVEVRPAREALLAGGDGAGYAVRLTGETLAGRDLPARRQVRAAALVRGRVHPATSALLRELGVEVVGW